MKITKALLEYYELTKSQYQPSTMNHHELIIKNLIKAFDSIKINQLEKIDIDAGYKLITFLKNNTTNHNNSINKHIRFLRRVMKHYKVLTSIEDLKLLSSDTKHFQRFSHDELKLIMQYTKNLSSSQNSIVYKTFVRVLLDSGLRLSEALKLRISDIDLYNKVITIYAPKTKKTRFAPFSDFSFNYIKRLIEVNPNREFLFYNFIQHREIIKSDIKNFYKRLRKKLNIKRIHTHRFRITFGSLLIENGMNIDDLQALYDHSRITTTILYVQHDKHRALQEYKKFNNWGLN